LWLWAQRFNGLNDVPAAVDARVLTFLVLILLLRRERLLLVVVEVLLVERAYVFLRCHEDLLHLSFPGR